jgi:hypothetical protein
MVVPWPLSIRSHDNLVRYSPEIIPRSKRFDPKDAKAGTFAILNQLTGTSRKGYIYANGYRRVVFKD